MRAQPMETDQQKISRLREMLDLANLRVAAFQRHIIQHDESCQDICGRGKDEAVECGYRAYFENNGRRCPTCPVHDQIGFPEEGIKGLGLGGQAGQGPL